VLYLSLPQDGVHQLREKVEGEDEQTEEQQKLLVSQDQRYINMKRSSELKVGHAAISNTCLLIEL